MSLLWVLKSYPIGFMKSTYGQGPTVTWTTFYKFLYIRIWTSILNIKIIFSIDLFIDFKRKPSTSCIFIRFSFRRDLKWGHIITSNSYGLYFGEWFLWKNNWMDFCVVLILVTFSISPRVDVGVAASLYFIHSWDWT